MMRFVNPPVRPGLGGLCLAALLCACPGPEPAPLTVELGTGAVGPFVPLQADGKLPMYRGPQGGQHVYVSLRARPLEAPQDATVTLSLTRVSDGQVVSSPFRVFLPLDAAPDEPGAYEHTGLPLQVLAVYANAGERVRLRILVETDGGRGEATHEGPLEWAE